MTDNMKLNSHVENIALKASKCLYLLKQLKRAGIDEASLVKFYCPCIRSVIEHGYQVFHSGLYPDLDSEDALKNAKANQGHFTNRGHLKLCYLEQQLINMYNLT